MRVEAEVYLKFYSILLEKFVEELETIVSEESIASGNVWLHKKKDKKTGKKDNEYLAVSLFDIKNPKYFYARKYNIDQSNPKTESVNNRSFYKALLFIGVDFPSEIDLKQLDGLPEVSQAKEYAQILFNEFNKTHFPDLANPKEKLFTEPSEIIEFKLVENIIHAFFAAIENQQLSVAWDMLSNDCRTLSNWGGDFELFENSFHVRSPLYNTSKYPSLIIGRSSIDDRPLSGNLNADIAFAKFIYSYKVVAVDVFHWTQLRQYDLNDLFKLHDNYDDSKKRLRAHKLTKIIDDTLNSVVSQRDLKEYKAGILKHSFNAPYLIMISRSNEITKLLPTPPSMMFYDQTTITCKFENGKWLIDFAGNICPALGRQK